jgi:hypothetical protein
MVLLSEIDTQEKQPQTSVTKKQTESQVSPPPPTTTTE